MDSKKLIELINIKEESIFALVQYYSKNGQYLTQLDVERICQDLVKKFIELHFDAFQDKQIQSDILNYFESIGVGDAGSCKDFSEALYQELQLYVDNQQDLSNYCC